MQSGIFCKRAYSAANLPDTKKAVRRNAINGHAIAKYNLYYFSFMVQYKLQTGMICADHDK